MNPSLAGFGFLAGYVVMVGVASFLEKFSMKQLNPYQVNFLMAIGMAVTAAATARAISSWRELFVKRVSARCSSIYSRSKKKLLTPLHGACALTLDCWQSASLMLLPGSRRKPTLHS